MYLVSTSSSIVSVYVNCKRMIAGLCCPVILCGQSPKLGIFHGTRDYVTEIKITALSPHLHIDNYGLIISPHDEEYRITCE